MYLPADVPRSSDANLVSARRWRHEPDAPTGGARQAEAWDPGARDPVAYAVQELEQALRPEKLGRSPDLVAGLCRERVTTRLAPAISPATREPNASAYTSFTTWARVSMGTADTLIARASVENLIRIARPSETGSSTRVYPLKRRLPANCTAARRFGYTVAGVVQ